MARGADNRHTLVQAHYGHTKPISLRTIYLAAQHQYRIYMYKQNMTRLFCSAHSPTTQQRNKFFAMPQNDSEWTNPKYVFASQSGQYLLSSAFVKTRTIQCNSRNSLYSHIFLDHTSDILLNVGFSLVCSFNTQILIFNLSHIESRPR